jgi:molybdopterin synthase catalytic subunit
MISIQTDDFDAGAEYEALRGTGPGTAAIVTLPSPAGHTGDLSGVTRPFLEHYPGMTEQVIQGLIDEAGRRWDVQRARVIHRVGRLALADQIVFVGVCSAHRGDAFAACEFIMDALKTSAPFWKKEITREGEHWVEQKESDVARSRNWE